MVYLVSQFIAHIISLYRLYCTLSTQYESIAVSDLVKLLSDENVDLQTNTLKLINALLTATSGTEETGRRFGMFAKLGVERTVNKFAPGQVRIGL